MLWENALLQKKCVQHLFLFRWVLNNLWLEKAIVISKHKGHFINCIIMVFGLNATDKTPIYKMPLTFEFGVGVLGWKENFLYWGFAGHLFGALVRPQSVLSARNQPARHIEVRNRKILACNHSHTQWFLRTVETFINMASKLSNFWCNRNGNKKLLVLYILSNS